MTAKARSGGAIVRRLPKPYDPAVPLAPWAGGARPDSSCLVIRYGAFGDHIMASSVLLLLRERWGHVTYNSDPRGYEILKHDPHVDAFFIQEKDQVPNAGLGAYWKALSNGFDRVVNLSESVEGTLLAVPGRKEHDWPDEVRRTILGSVNYLERHHDLAGVAHRFRPAFHPSPAEAAWAARRRRRIGGRLVLWCLSGSSVHKTYPWVGDMAERILRETDWRLAFVGDRDDRPLEELVGQQALAAVGHAPRAQIYRTGHAGIVRAVAQRFGRRVTFAAGRWPIRRTLALARLADVVAGPETGVMNAVSHEPTVAKVAMLSHSSHRNLTQHWVNTAVLEPDRAKVPCFPCHRLHYTREFCPADPASGAARCAASIPPGAVVAAIGARLTAKEAA